MDRKQVDENAVNLAVARVKKRIESRLLEKGRGTYASSHETLGILEEEMHELREAVRSNSLTRVEKELMDIAVGATFALACFSVGGPDWPVGG